MPKKEAKLSVIVGDTWPDGLEIAGDSKRPKQIDPKVKVVLTLVMGAGVLVAVFAGFALVQGDSLLTDRIFNLAERLLLVAVGWIGHAASKEK